MKVVIYFLHISQDPYRSPHVGEEPAGHGGGSGARVPRVLQGGYFVDFAIWKRKWQLLL